MQRLWLPALLVLLFPEAAPTFNNLARRQRTKSRLGPIIQSLCPRSLQNQIQNHRMLPKREMTKVFGIIDDVDSGELSQRAEQKKMKTRIATTKETMVLRDKFEERRQKTQEQGGETNEDKKDAKIEIDMNKYVIAYKKNGGRLAVPRKQIFTQDQDLNYGVFGRGEMHWYELWLAGKPNAIERDLVERIEALPRTKNFKTKRPILRECTFWAPSKKVKNYNPETGRTGTRTLRFSDGERVFVKLVLDNLAYEVIKDDKRIHGFLHCHNFDQQPLPYPAPGSRLREAEEWMAIDHDRTKEQVLMEKDGQLIDSKEGDSPQNPTNKNKKSKGSTAAPWDPFADAEEMNI
mmetsp:Transcript_24380/g.36578  ORF Transcript_24380/g.36578 Transcript_24380/m.36578 type:complete len:348 (-) Transcript_24380:99-1142(-)